MYLIESWELIIGILEAIFQHFLFSQINKLKILILKNSVNSLLQGGAQCGAFAPLLFTKKNYENNLMFHFTNKKKINRFVKGRPKTIRYSILIFLSKFRYLK